MLPVTEGLLVAVLGTHLVLLVFVVWQIAQCLRRVALHIRRARRLVIGKMDCDKLIDELMLVADPQGAGSCLAKGAPPAAATAAMPDAGAWSRKRAERLDFINEELCRQGHAVQTFQDVDAAMQEYAQVTRHNLNPLGPEPQLADFYHPSDGQKDREIAFVILGMAATCFVAYQLVKK